SSAGLRAEKETITLRAADDLSWLQGQPGLNFACTRCGKCCSGEKDLRVWITDKEMDKLAEAKGIFSWQFMRDYVETNRSPKGKGIQRFSFFITKLKMPGDM